VPELTRECLDIATLYEECFPRVFSFALRMLGDEEAARDAAQETFAIVIAKSGGFRGESAVLTWVLSIAKNLCRKRLKGGRERSFGDIEALVDRFSREPSSAHSDLERRFYVEEVKEGCLVGLLQCLPFAQRCAFVLNLLCGLPIAEVGRVMGRSENSIRILLSRARSGIRAFLCENCSLMGAGNKCSCANMIEFSLARDLIERYRPGLGVPEIKDELRRFADEVELYRSLPEPEAAIASALESGRYAIFEKRAK
jgi:RNA polymerase sigma factor (sigma-70 family)